MPRPDIDHGYTEQLPSVKFPEVGCYVVGALVNIKEFQETDFATGEPLTWPSGDPKMQKRIRMILVKGENVEFSGDQTPGPGNVVQVWVSGTKMREYREAVKKFRQTEGKSPTVGTVLRVKFAKEEPSKTRGFNPRKILEFTYRPEGPNDQKWGDLAEEQWKIEQQEAVPQRPEVPAYEEEDPF